MAFLLFLSGVRCLFLPVFSRFLTAGRERHTEESRKTRSINTFFCLASCLLYYTVPWPLDVHTPLATSMPSARLAKLVGAIVACSLLLVALSVDRPECFNDDNKRCTAVEEIDRYFGFASLMLLLIVGATWPLIVLIAVVTALCCHCRHRKKRINYNALSMITAEERKERKQYMAQFNPSQARPVVEAAPVAKMV